MHVPARRHLPGQCHLVQLERWKDVFRTRALEQKHSSYLDSFSNVQASKALKPEILKQDFDYAMTHMG